MRVAMPVGRDFILLADFQSAFFAPVVFPPTRQAPLLLHALRGPAEFGGVTTNNKRLLQNSGMLLN
jgi:hypothetical protein